MDPQLNTAAGGLMALIGSPLMLELVAVATLAGVLIGVVPGLGGKAAIAVLIPVTFGMDPLHGAVMLVAMHAAVGTGSAIPSILLGIPGTGSSAATVVDGFPMTKRGEAGRAVGASLAASAVGGIIGAGILAAIFPFAVPIVLAFGPPEIFALTLLGITFIASLSGRSLLRGLIVGCLGLMMSYVGLDPQTGVQRFTFGQLFLWDGIDLVTALVAVFAIPEIVAMGLRHGTISRSDETAASYSMRQVIDGVADAFRHVWLLARTSALGTLIGLIPGLGGAVASWLAYGHAVQSSREPAKFGYGEVAGVIAPEAANNSKEGGALLPTLLFGIPGSSGMAVLLGGLISLGITPGIGILTSEQPLVWTLIWTLVIANLLAVLIFLAAARWIGLAAFVNVQLLVPFVLAFCLLGSWLSSSAIQNLLLLLMFGAVGYALKRSRWPIPPFAVGLVLGRTSEQSLHQSLDIWGAEAFLRPITLCLLALAVSSVAFYLFRRRSRTERVSCGRGDFLLTVALLCVFTTMCLFAFDYPQRARLVPLVIGIPAVLLCVAEFVRVIRFLPAWDRAAWKLAGTGSGIRRECVMFCWLALFVTAVWVVGFVGGIAIAVALFLILDRKLRLLPTVVVALASGGLLYLAFDRLLGLALYEGLLGF